MAETLLPIPVVNIKHNDCNLQSGA